MDSIFAQIGKSSLVDITLQQQWNELKTAVANHNVIPVIGPNMQIAPVATPYGATCNAQKVLLNELAKYLGLSNTPTSYQSYIFFRVII